MFEEVRNWTREEFTLALEITFGRLGQCDMCTRAGSCTKNGTCIRKSRWVIFSPNQIGGLCRDHWQHIHLDKDEQEKDGLEEPLEI